MLGARIDLIVLMTGACVTLYAAALLLQPDAIFAGRGFLSILSPGTRALYQLGMTGGVAWQLDWHWTHLTAIYLHGGLLHILFNVMWIRNLGPAAAEAFGPSRTFVLFNVAGAAGFLLSNVMSGMVVLYDGANLFGFRFANLNSGVPTIGASGAIFGLLAALIVYGRKRGSSVMTQQLWQWAIILGILGFLIPAVNNWAHGGGFAAGWITAHLMGFNDEQRESSAVMLLALGLIVATAVGIALSFYRVHNLLLTG